MARFDGIKSVLMVIVKVYIIKSQQTFQNLVRFRFQQKYKKYTFNVTFSRFDLMFVTTCNLSSSPAVLFNQPAVVAPGI
jgi:hypothetical protein